MAAPRISVTSSSVPAARSLERSSAYKTRSSPTRNAIRLPRATTSARRCGCGTSGRASFSTRGFCQARVRLPISPDSTASSLRFHRDTDLLPILAYAPQSLANRPDWKDVFVSRYHLDYNKDMVGAGLFGFVDVYNFHCGTDRSRRGALSLASVHRGSPRVVEGSQARVQLVTISSDLYTRLKR